MNHNRRQTPKSREKTKFDQIIKHTIQKCSFRYIFAFIVMLECIAGEKKIHLRLIDSSLS